MRTEKEVRESLKRLESIHDKTDGPQWYRMMGHISALRWMLEVQRSTPTMREKIMEKQGNKKTLELTSKELTLLFYMAGYSCKEASKAFPEEYASFMKKINEANRCIFWRT